MQFPCPQTRGLTPGREVMIRRAILYHGHFAEIVLVLLAMGLPMVSLMASMASGYGEWFQRSGSLMVLFSAAVEYRRRHLLNIRGTTTGRLLWRQIPYVCYSSIFLGTVIWGYGDLPFR